MRLTIAHLTRYPHLTQIHDKLQLLRLTPRTDGGQQVRHWQLQVQGEMHAFADAFGNHCHTLAIDTAHQDVLIKVTGEIETGLQSSVADTGLPLPVYLRTTPLSAADAALHAFAQRFAGRPLTGLMLAISDQMPYRQGITDVHTTAAQAFQLGAGACQDLAHVMLACCRSLGLPARYVSGYLFTADGSLLQTHAWVEVWQHTHWLGLDVCNRMPVDERHVRLAIGLDDRDASPVSGRRIGDGDEHLSSLVNINQTGNPIARTALTPDAALTTAQAAQQQQ